MLPSPPLSAAPADPPRPEAPTRLEPLCGFQDVLAGPSADRDTPGVLWPDFDAQIGPRLWRRGRRVCLRPQIDASAAAEQREPAVFVSMYDNHFGHLVAETVPRLAQSLAEAPGVPLWFTSNQPVRGNHPSPMFRAVFDWLGIPMAQLRFLHRPTLFRALHVAAQAEHLDGPPTAEGYLDLLEARIAGRYDPRRPSGVTFVTRAGLNAKKGCHAGERYLVACLRALGVRIVYPEALPLPEQMQVYAQSRHLVFSEGSALHGRQLLGRLDQHVSVLRRRFRSHMARHQIEPRCASLTYVSCFGGSLFVTDAAGRKIHHAMSSLYEIAPVLDHFESLNIPLRRVWDRRLYERTRDEDVLRWVASIYAPDTEHWLRPHNSDAELLDQLGPLGLGHLRGAVATLIRQRQEDRTG